MEAPGAPRDRNRRNLLTAALATVAATTGARFVGGSVARADDVVAGQPLLGGKVNLVYSSAAKTAGATTYVTSRVENFSVLNVSNDGGAGALFAPAVQAFGASMGVGARAPSGDAPKIGPTDRVGVRAFGATHGVFADSDGIGVYGKATVSGVQGETNAGAGVVGKSQTGAGVLADSETGTGVLAATRGGESAAAVHGFARSGGVGLHGEVSSGIAVKAESETGLGIEVTGADGARIVTRSAAGVGLSVVGTVEFSQAGKATIPAGKRQARVTGLALTAASAALASLNNVLPDTYIQGVRVVPPDSLVVVLNKKAARGVNFSYFAFSAAELAGRATDSAGDGRAVAIPTAGMVLDPSSAPAKFVLQQKR